MGKKLGKRKKPVTCTTGRERVPCRRVKRERNKTYVGPESGRDVPLRGRGGAAVMEEPRGTAKAGEKPNPSGESRKKVGLTWRCVSLAHGQEGAQSNKGSRTSRRKGGG